MLGLFLSPDNYVQAPGFSQNFNRYAYCVNNPLGYVDPSGEFITWSIGKNGLSIGFNLTPIGIPIGAGINMGWSNGPSAGIYVEFGPRIGGTGLGSGFTQQYSLDYNFKHGFWSTTTSVGAYASVGPFTAGVNFSITYTTNNDFPTAGWGVYAGIGIGGEKGSLDFTVGYGSAGWSYGIGGSYYTAYERAYMRAEARFRERIISAVNRGLGYVLGASGPSIGTGEFGYGGTFKVGVTIDPAFPGVIIVRGEYWADLTGHGRYSHGVIFIPKNTPAGIQLGYVQHEYGHYLQEQSLPRSVYNKMAIASFLDAIFSNDHSHFWVETDANVRAAAFFPPTLNKADIHNDALWPKVPNH